jgi:site-specific DNA-methyltransferase (adenine-specific)
VTDSSEPVAAPAGSPVAEPVEAPAAGSPVAEPVEALAADSRIAEAVEAPAAGSPVAEPVEATTARTATSTAPALGAVEIVHGEALNVARTLPDASFTLVYLDPPFNTGRTQERHAVSSRRADRPAGTIQADRAGGGGSGPESADASDSSLNSAVGKTATGAREINHGFHGHRYERVRELLHAYDDRFDDYGDFLMPRLEEAWRLLADDGTL